MKTGQFKTKILFICHVNLLPYYLSFVFYLNDNLTDRGGKGEGVIRNIDSLSYLFLTHIFFSTCIHFIFLFVYYHNFLIVEFEEQIPNVNEKMETLKKKHRDALSTSYPPTSCYLQCRPLDFKWNTPIAQHSK